MFGICVVLYHIHQGFFFVFVFFCFLCLKQEDIISRRRKHQPTYTGNIKTPKSASRENGATNFVLVLTSHQILMED